MILQHTYKKVLDGSKTQTRRIVKLGDAWWAEGVSVTTNHRLKWKVGKTYAVQPGRNKKQIGRIRITGIRQERVQEISEADAIAEGSHAIGLGDTPKVAFSALWESVHGPGSWTHNPLVWVLEFELVA